MARAAMRARETMSWTLLNMSLENNKKKRKEFLAEFIAIVREYPPLHSRSAAPRVIHSVPSLCLRSFVRGAPLGHHFARRRGGRQQVPREGGGVEDLMG